MAHRSNSNNQEDRHLRYLPPPFHIPPIPPRSRSRSSHANRYPSAIGSGAHRFPTQSSSQRFPEPSSQEQAGQERYSMEHAEKRPSRSPYPGIFASPSSGPVSHPVSANSRVGVETEGYFSGINANDKSNISQASSGHISPGTLSPFITGPGSGSGSGRSGHEYPYPATLHEPRPIHPPTTVPMQLEYILNRSGWRSSAAPSPLSTLPSNQEGMAHDSSTLHNPPSSGQERTVSTSGTENANDNTNSNTSRTPPQATTTTTTTTTMATTPIRMEFEPVTAHTAKCDLCNSRNDSGMSRCASCGWQSCHACTIANGCTRTHNAGSRLHTGPIERIKLVSTASSSKGRVGKRARAQPRKREGKGEGEDVGAHAGPTRWSKRQQRARNQRSRKSGGSQEGGHGGDANTGSSSPPRPSPPLDNEGSSSPAANDLSETEKMLQGARNLYAFSIEAWGEWAHEQSRRGISNEHAGIENLHSYAQDEATRALEEYRQREAGRVNGVWS